MIDPAHITLIKTYLEAYNRFDIDGLIALMSDDVRFEHHANGELSVATDGKADFEKLARVGAALFASRQQFVTALHEVPGDADTVIAEIDFHGEIADDIPDGPGAGTVIEMHGTSEFLFAGGKIARVIDKA
jgi:steroid delta-isomerase-like uncharacterized protein